jgi:hypothetical protein
VRWEHAESVARQESEPGFQVDRGRFDALLLACAQQAGATCIQPGHAVAVTARPAFGGSAAWHVDVETSGPRVRVAARFLIDASGRRSGLLGRLASAGRAGPATAALYAYWRGVSLAGWETRVEAGEDSWYWGAPLPDGTFNATVFVDARACASLRGARRLAAYRALLAQSTLLAGCMGGELASDVRACDASMFEHEEPAGPTFARAGEAAFAIDPLSSQGVQSALASGLAAAAVAHTILTRPERTPLAIEFLARRQGDIVARHRRLAASHYAARARTTDTPFWRARAVVADPPNASQRPSGVRETRAPRDGSLIVVSPDARLALRPVLEGSLIDERPTLEHPSLARPTAFLGAVPIGELLRAFDRPATSPDLVARWCRTVPPRTCWDVLDWLWERRILSRADETPKIAGMD